MRSDLLCSMAQQVKFITWYREDAPPPAAEGEEQVQPKAFISRREAFDLKGRRVHIVRLAPSGASIQEINRLYDEADRLALNEIKDYTKNILERTAFHYDESGVLRQELIFLGEKLYQKRRYIYDEAGRETERRIVSADDAVLRREVFTRDENGRISEQLHYKGPDNLEWKKTLTYNDKGRVTAEDYVYLEGNRGEEKFTYGYDEKGNRTSALLKNANGIVEKEILRKYDEKGRLVWQLKKGSEAAPEEIVSQWLYDGDGRMVHEEEYNVLLDKLSSAERTRYHEEGTVKSKEILDFTAENPAIYSLLPQYEYYPEQQAEDAKPEAVEQKA